MTPGAGTVAPSGSGPGERYGFRLLLVAGAAALVAVPFASITFSVIGDGPLIAWDGRIADALNRWVHRRPVVLDGLELVSWFGRPPVLAAVVVAAAVWCRSGGRRRLAVFLLATTASGAVVGTVVKLAVDRPRPVVDHPVSTAFGDSFPSGHAMHSTVTYGALALVVLPLLHPGVRRGVVAVTVLVVAAIGSSRLLLGLHFLTDVVGGFLLGAAWLALGAATFRVWREEVPVVDVEDDRIGLDTDEPAGPVSPTGDGPRRVGRERPLHGVRSGAGAPEATLGADRWRD